MTTSEMATCPSPTVLSDFLSGRLAPTMLQQCESHVAQCPECHETLREISPSDTLSDQVAMAMMPDEAMDAAINAVPDAEVEAMISRASSSDFRERSLTDHKSDESQTGEPSRQSDRLDAEILADRAAEVLRCIEPDDEDSLTPTMPIGSDNGPSLGTLGDYRLLRLVGAGATGVVFQALDMPLDRLVALKILRPSLGPISRQRFLAEARSAASIEHANVVTIFQVGQTDQLAFIAMPWQPGETLAAKLDRGESFDETLIRKWVAEIAAGLHAAHGQQLVHRDIKPANIWITEDDQNVRILDFGLARIADETPGLTATGMLAGTPNYMSPEQARGQELDGRSDLFSLGCVLYQLLTGRMPFGGPNILATLQAIVSHEPTPPCLTSTWSKFHSRDLSDLAMCLLEKQSDNRPQSADQLQVLLAEPRARWPIAVAKYRSTAAEAPTDQPAKVRTGRSNRGRFTAAVAAGALGLAAWMWGPQVFRIVTDRGEVVVETLDQNVEVRVLESGNRIRVVDAGGGTSFDLDAGAYQIEAVDRESQQPMNVKPTTIMISRGGKQVVKVTQRPLNFPAQVGASNGPTKSDWNERPRNRYSRTNTIYDRNSDTRNSPLQAMDLAGTADPSDPRLATREDTSSSYSLRSDDSLPPAFSDRPATRAEVRSLTRDQAFAERRRMDLNRSDTADRRFATGEDPTDLSIGSEDGFEMGYGDRPATSENFQTPWRQTEINRDEDRLVAAPDDRRRSDDRWGSTFRNSTEPSFNDDTRSRELAATVDARVSREEKPSPAAAPEPIAPPSEPLYQGRTFDHWLQVAKFDRDYKACAEALKACAMTADEESQKEALLAVTRTLVRKFGTNIIGANDRTDQYYTAFLEVMQSTTPEQTFDFFVREANDGNRRSRNFLWAWAARLQESVDTLSPIPGATLEYFHEHLPQLFEAINTAWTIDEDSDFAVGILNSTLVRETDALDAFAQSPLYERLKQTILTTETAAAGNVPYVAARYFANDPEVFSQYESILLDGTANKFQQQTAWNTFLASDVGLKSEKFATRVTELSLKVIDNAVGTEELVKLARNGVPVGLMRKEIIETALRRINDAMDAMKEPQRADAAIKLEALQQTVIPLEIPEDPFGDPAPEIWIQFNDSEVSNDMGYLIAKLRGETLPTLQKNSVFKRNLGGGGWGGMGGGGMGGGGMF